MKKMVWMLSFFMVFLATGHSFAMTGVKTSGFVDLYYGYNFNNVKPESNANNLRNFDLHTNQFSVNLVEIVLQRDPSVSDPTGFRFDLDFGPTTDLVTGCPASTDCSAFKNVQQAYISFLAGKATVDVGKMVTHLGYEVIETKDNANYSRSFLFAYSIPYYHSGLRVSYPVSDNIWVNGYAYNGWNVVQDTDPSLTYGATVGLKSSNTRLTFVQNWYHGDSRDVLDTVLIVKPTEKTTFGLNYDYGSLKNGAADGSDGLWSGVAVYASHPCSDKFTTSVRYEVFNDRDGAAGTGASGEVKEVTLTGEYKMSDNLMTRMEVRTDWAEANAQRFKDGDSGGTSDDQTTALVGLVYTF